MTKLEQIVKRAKQIRLAQPKKFAKWTDYVKYASKDLADKVVGKKKTVGAALAKPKKKAIAPGRKPIAAVKKPTAMHKDSNSHNVKIKVISGFSELSSGAKKQYDYIKNSRLVKYMDMDTLITYLYDDAVKKKQNKKASDLFQLKKWFNSKY